MEAVWATVGLVVVILAGATTQRLTGMGFALVAAPFLVLLMGAATSVPLLQVLGILASIIVLASTFRDVQWMKVAMLVPPALVGMVPGWLLFRWMEPAALSVLIGSLVLAALLAMVFDKRSRIFRGTGGLVGAGTLSGFMNVTASIGGPPLVLYMLSTAWEHRHFVASSQVYFIAINIGSLLFHGIPPLGSSTWALVVGTMLAGMVVGHVLSKKVKPQAASRLVVMIAVLGSVASIVRGVGELL